MHGDSDDSDWIPIIEEEKETTTVVMSRSLVDEHNNNNQDECSSEESNSDWISLYLTQLDKRPLITKMVTASLVAATGALIGARKPLDKGQRENSTRHSHWSGPALAIDWMEVLSFALYGGLVGGPITHFWNEWLEQIGPSNKTKALLLDQLGAQPIMLLLMHSILDVTQTSITKFPSAVQRSWSTALAPSLVISWRFWPVSLYLLLRFVKKRRHFAVATNICSIFWMSRIAGLRSKLRRHPDHR